MQIKPASVTEPYSELQQLGRYRLLSPLGQGGMGTIHLAVVSGMGEFQKLVVVKELRRDLTRNQDFVSLFLQEAKLAGRLNHANVVQTLEAGQIGDRYFLSMEFLDGQPLNQIVRSASQQPEFTLQLRLQVICDALAGLHYAHELRDYDGRPLEIVHCDVSPPNVFVTYDGHVKVVDFGIAKAAGADIHSATHFKGKLRYAAPEQILGEAVDRRADIFAAGVMLWESIALRRFATGSPEDQTGLEKRVRGTETRISRLVPNVAPALSVICDTALHRDPKQRFATAEEFRQTLLSYLATLGPPADPREIGALVSAKFATQRAAMHRIIHEQLGGEHSTIKLRQRSPVADPGEDEETTVADLSELVESSRLSSFPPPHLDSFRPSARKLWIPVGVVAGMVGIGVAASLSLPGGDGAGQGDATQQPISMTNHVAVAAADAAQQRSAPDKPADRQVAVRLPAAAVEAPESAADTREGKRGTEHKKAKSASKGDSTSRLESAKAATPEPVEAKRRAKPSDDKNAAFIPEAAPKPEPTERAEQPVRSESSVKLPGSGAGTDLNVAEKRARRELDDNPFQ